MDRVYNKIFILVFILALAVPFALAHREEGRVSDMENRTLAGLPHLRDEEGKWNIGYPGDFDAWINDNIRFRGVLVKLNSSLQYRLFGRVMKESMREGKEGHLYYVDEAKVREYQHLNLLSEDELDRYTKSMKGLKDYLEERGISFYYMQCYEKDAVYPEYFVDGVNQFGEISRARQIVNALEQEAGIVVAPVYEELLSHKGEELLYFKVSDPAHWNEYGAHLGYEALMRTVQEDYPALRYMTEEDYHISRFTDKASLYGFTYPYPEDSLRFEIKNPQAVEMDLDGFDPEGVVRYREYGHYFINEACENDWKILVLGDSYIRQFLKEHIAEGFRETLSIDMINLPNLDKTLEIYDPDIVVFESSENGLNQSIPLVEEIAYTRK